MQFVCTESTKSIRIRNWLHSLRRCEVKLVCKRKVSYFTWYYVIKDNPHKETDKNSCLEQYGSTFIEHRRTWKAQMIKGNRNVDLSYFAYFLNAWM